MSIYNLLEYSDNYFVRLGSLQNHHRDGMIDDANQNPAAGDHRENKTATSRFSEYKKKIIGSTPTDSNKLDTEAAIPLKKFINLRKSFDFSLINCEIELDLR